MSIRRRGAVTEVSRRIGRMQSDGLVGIGVLGVFRAERMFYNRGLSLHIIFTVVEVKIINSACPRHNYTTTGASS